MAAGDSSSSSTAAKKSDADASSGDVTMGGTEKKEEEEVFFPKFELAHLKARYMKDRAPPVLKQIEEYIKQDRMLGFYLDFCEEANLKRDEALVKQLEKEKAEKIKELEARHLDAEENLGDIEVKNSLLARADFLNQIGDFSEAVVWYEKAFEKTVGVGYRMDNLLTRLRIALFCDDKENTKKLIDAGHAELKKGGDWERKNKLKVYEGIFKVSQADFEGAANLFLQGVATFAATEIFSFREFIFYTVMCAMMGLPRGDLKKKVIESPEILSVIHEKPHVKEFLFAYFLGYGQISLAYNCDYRQWTREFAEVIDHLKPDRYFDANLTKITRILRLNAYRQFITSYKSVTLKLMADTFGVTEEFLDGEIYNFIASGRLLNCKIDKVSRLIETLDNVKDEKALLYKDILKEGDELLNKMQKLSSAIDR
eukprot:g8635.t1